MPVWFAPVVFGLAYFGFAALSGYFARWTHSILYVWLASGLYVGALIVTAPRMWPALIVAATIGDFGFNQLWEPWPIPRMILAHLGNTVSAVFGAWLVLHFVSKRPTLSSVRELVGVVGLGGMLGSVPSALMGGKIIQRLTSGSDYWVNFTGWYSSDLLGVVLVAPVILVWQRGVERPASRRFLPRAVEYVTLMVGLIAIISLAFYLGWLRQTETLSLAYPFTIWAALRFGLRGSTAAVLMTAMLAQTFTALGYGVVGASALPDSQKAIEMMVSLGIFAIVSLLPATVFTALKVSQRREKIRTRTMTLMATGANLPAILDSIVVGVEMELPGSRGQVLLTDPAGTHLIVGSAPNLPAFFNEAIQGSAIGQNAWVCGAAADAHRRVVVEDLKTNPQTASTFELAARAGLRSGWAEPFSDSAGRLLGAFGVYYGERRIPTLMELELVESAARIAGIAAERKQLELQFLRAQRLEGIGTLAGGIAHDLNNVLAPIVIGADILRDVPLDEHDRSVLNNMEVSARRGAALVRQVLTFARGLDGTRETLNVAEIVRQTETITATTFPKNITVVTDVPASLPRIQADRTQIEQVLLNLAVNARDAMPNGGQLAITGRTVYVDEVKASRHAGVRAGEFVVIEVVDSGFGIRREVIHRIFEPFFTTKQVGQGTGLGLSTSLGIVRSHDGFIEVVSEGGQGSAFYVYLPACVTGSSPPFNGESAGAVRGHGEMVLVVDDELAIRETTRLALAQLGYRVMVAANGAEALALVAMPDSEIAVVVTDMMMPVMAGSELISALEYTAPHLAIVTVSGLHARENPSTTMQRPHLQKPYSVDDLAALIASVLPPKA